MGNNVLVIAEQRDGVLKKVAFEMLGVGAQLAAALGGQVEAALLGAGQAGLPDTLAQYGAAKVYVADDESLAAYSAEGYTNTLAAFIGKVEPTIILLGATALGKDLAPRLAARLGVGLATDCTALEIADGRLLATRPIYWKTAKQTTNMDTATRKSSTCSKMMDCAFIIRNNLAGSVIFFLSGPDVYDGGEYLLHLKGGMDSIVVTKFL